MSEQVSSQTQSRSSTTRIDSRIPQATPSELQQAVHSIHSHLERIDQRASRQRESLGWIVISAALGHVGILGIRALDAPDVGGLLCLGGGFLLVVAAVTGAISIGRLRP